MQPIQYKTQRSEMLPPESEPDKKKIRLDGFSPPPVGTLIQTIEAVLQNIEAQSAQSQHQAPPPSIREREIQIMTSSDVSTDSDEEFEFVALGDFSCNLSLPDNADNRKYIGKTLVADLAQKPFTKDDRTALNDKEMRDLGVSFRYFENEDHEIGIPTDSDEETEFVGLEESPCDLSLPGNADNGKYIGKTLMADLAQKLFTRDDRTALNDKEMRDLGVSFKYSEDEDHEIGVPTVTDEENEGDEISVSTDSDEETGFVALGESPCDLSLPGNAGNREYIGKTLMADLAQKPFTKDDRTALNDKEMQDLGVLLKCYKSEGHEIGEKDLEKLANLTVEVKAIGQWECLAQGKMIAEVEKVLQNYHPAALKTWMIAVYHNYNTPTCYLNYYKFHKFLRTYYSNELWKLTLMLPADAYLVAKCANQIQSAEEKVKILNNEWDSIQKKALQKPEKKKSPFLVAPPKPIVPTAPPELQFIPAFAIPLNDDEKDKLHSLLHNEDQEVLRQLLNLTDQIKAIKQWDRDRQGEKIAEVQDLLQNCDSTVFNKWLKIVYNNVTTPTTYLHYHKFSKSLSEQRQDLCPKYKNMPLVCADFLASRSSGDSAQDFAKKVEIIENWNPQEKGKAGANKLQATIRAAFKRRYVRKTNL